MKEGEKMKFKRISPFAGRIQSAELRKLLPTKRDIHGSLVKSGIEDLIFEYRIVPRFNSRDQANITLLDLVDLKCELDDLRLPTLKEAVAFRVSADNPVDASCERFTETCAAYFKRDDRIYVAFLDRRLPRFKFLHEHFPDLRGGYRYRAFAERDIREDYFETPLKEAEEEERALVLAEKLRHLSTNIYKSGRRRGKSTYSLNPFIQTALGERLAKIHARHLSSLRVTGSISLMNPQFLQNIPDAKVWLFPVVLGEVNRYQPNGSHSRDSLIEADGRNGTEPILGWDSHSNRAYLLGVR